MIEQTTLLSPLKGDDANALFAEVFEGEDPDSRGYLLKEGRPTTIGEVERLVSSLVEGGNKGQLRPFLSSTRTGVLWVGAL